MWKACSHTFFLLVVVSQAGAATLWAREHGVPVPEMVFVHGGTFETGGDPNKDVSGREYVLCDFWIGRTEVTFGQFDSFCEETGYYEERFSKGIVSPVHDGERRGIWKATQPEGSAPDAEPPEHPLRNYPAIEVCWLDACAFCLWLSEKTGIGFRLPTQAEWEYACTARGTQPAVESDRLGEVAWFAESANRRDGRTQIRPVAAKMANSLGLYDMLGNVWEWCLDGPTPLDHSDAIEEWQRIAKTHTPLDLTAKGSPYWESVSLLFHGPKGNAKALRGGAWCEVADRVTPTYRMYYRYNYAAQRVGFRVVCTKDPSHLLDANPAQPANKSEDR